MVCRSATKSGTRKASSSRTGGGAITSQHQAQEEAENEELLQTTSNTPGEFTTLLLNRLEDLSGGENWDDDLRTSMHQHLVDFLDQTGSHDPTYPIHRYEQYRDQLMTAQVQRLRTKCGTDMRILLKETGHVKRIVKLLPTAVQNTFKEHVYNPEKIIKLADVNDEAEYELDDPQEEGHVTPRPTSKRQGSTIIPPEAKKASQPQPPAPYRNSKQATVPSEAQVHGQVDEDLED